MKSKIQSGINVILYIDNMPVAGQEGAVLNRSTIDIDITNKINNSWQESLSGTKTWDVNCSGTYIVNSKSFEMLEEAFLNNKEIDVAITLNDYISYKGKCLIIDFPLSAIFNNSFKYSLTLLGTGELVKVSE